MEVLPQRIWSYLERNQGEMAELLKALVLAESPSLDPPTQQAVFKRLSSELRSLDFEVRLVPGSRSGGQLFARPAKRLKRHPLQLLLGHGDTVWPIGTLERMPFQARDGFLHGPGIYDMKGGLAQMVFALRSLREAEVTPSVTPLIFINSDEEIGSIDSDRWIRRLARRSDRVLVLEPSLGKAGLLKTARKGVGQFVIQIHGKAAHAGLEPEKGASAIQELAHVIKSLHGLNDPERGVTVNVGIVKGGLRPNVVAPEAEAVVDVRVLDEDDARRIGKEIRYLQPVTPQVRLEIRGAIDRPPLQRTPGNRRLWGLAKQMADRLGLEIGEATAGGGSDGNTTSLYAPTLDGLGAVGRGAHSEEECIDASKMVERSALLALILAAPALNSPGEPRPFPAGD